MKKDALYWDGYFMALAKVSALRSKDPSTRVGACIVNEDKRVISLGYNGMPKGIDDSFPWEREGEDSSKTKYAYVIHAEMNAILNNHQSLKGCTLYTSLFPCSNCAKTVAQSGIEKVIYEDDKYTGTLDDDIARKILTTAGIKFEKISIPTDVSINVGDEQHHI
ncbi:deoxycytidylate deaminase [Mycoplasmopsis opalescens]|uniref:deoxycytidylate deaminase n=1 Tax=Mycoplasmopsis opalescens TaxID=114886 RepID=UPI0004A71FD5|nr:dCMP deaminase family protein [Mycoplasmopsis opalescens]